MLTNHRSNGFESIAQTCRALGDKTRLAVVYELLGREERNVGELATRLGESQPNISKHLKRLRRAGLLARRKDGLQVYYRLTDPRIARLWQLLDGPMPKPRKKRRSQTAV